MTNAKEEESRNTKKMITVTNASFDYKTDAATPHTYVTKEQVKTKPKLIIKCTTHIYT